MARRYKPLPAGAIVWVRHWQYFAEVITDAGAGEVKIRARMRKYDYERWARRSQIRPATPAEADAHRQRVAQYALARVAPAGQAAEVTHGTQI